VRYDNLKLSLAGVALLCLAGWGLSNRLNHRQPSVEEKPKEKVVYHMVADTLKSGESLYLSLRKKGVPGTEIQKLMDASANIVNLRRSYPGEYYLLSYDSTKTISRFEYHRNSHDVLVVERKGGKFQAHRQQAQYEMRVRWITGRVSGTLWDSILNKGEKPDLVLAFTDIFQWNVDFLVDPRDGDEFTIIFEEYRNNGTFVKYGRILAAKYKDLVAILYRDPEGHQDYYDPRGRSLRKAFLRSPLNYRRISSGFSYRRLHPIYKIYRPHPGIDYAAPVGTPVVASADGTVVYAGWKNGFGKFIKINHGNGYYTTYGHLSRYAKGIRRGIRVRQGQVIGYVGRTGIATGPHLDYRFIKDGRFLNPLTVDIPGASSVKKRYIEEFYKAKDKMLDALIFSEERKMLAEREPEAVPPQ